MLKEAQHELEETTLQKTRFVKLFKQTQTKLINQEKNNVVAVSSVILLSLNTKLSRKQTIIDSLKTEKQDLLSHIQQLKAELEAAKKPANPVSLQRVEVGSLDMVKGMALKR